MDKKVCKISAVSKDINVKHTYNDDQVLIGEITKMEGDKSHE
ncbi:hypothetical protein [Lysinibacillus yapensis]|nr:hypothetical protein [Lysinibacillus yapensis]